MQPLLSSCKYKVTCGTQICPAVAAESHYFCSFLQKLEHKWLRCFKRHTRVPQSRLKRLDMSTHISDTLYFLVSGQMAAETDWVQSGALNQVWVCVCSVLHSMDAILEKKNSALPICLKRKISVFIIFAKWALKIRKIKTFLSQWQMCLLPFLPLQRLSRRMSGCKQWIIYSLTQPYRRASHHRHHGRHVYKSEATAWACLESSSANEEAATQ